MGTGRIATTPAFDEGSDMKKMLSAKLQITAAIVAFAATPLVSRAADDGSKYPANQLTLDMFGSYIKDFHDFGDQFDHNWRHGQFGGGAGVNYFFSKYAGIGADSFTYDEGEFFKNVSGNVYLRLPIESIGIAPYIFGGGGRDFNPVAEWHEDAGVGLEYRFSRHVGIFSDIRYIWEGKTANASLVRVGVQFGL
jgi:hypothetical protein